MAARSESKGEARVLCDEKCEPAVISTFVELASVLVRTSSKCSCRRKSSPFNSSPSTATRPLRFEVGSKGEFCANIRRGDSQMTGCLLLVNDVFVIRFHFTVGSLRADLPLIIFFTFNAEALPFTGSLLSSYEIEKTWGGRESTREKFRFSQLRTRSAPGKFRFRNPFPFFYGREPRRMECRAARLAVQTLITFSSSKSKIVCRL